MEKCWLCGQASFECVGKAGPAVLADGGNLFCSRISIVSGVSPSAMDSIIPVFSASGYILGFLGILIVHRIFVVLYRVFFHPLSRFPGPALAASTTLYRAYYQVYRDGDHLAQATRLHETYGDLSPSISEENKIDR